MAHPCKVPNPWELVCSCSFRSAPPQVSFCRVGAGWSWHSSWKAEGCPPTPTLGDILAWPPQVSAWPSQADLCSPLPKGPVGRRDIGSGTWEDTRAAVSDKPASRARPGPARSHAAPPVPLASGWAVLLPQPAMAPGDPKDKARSAPASHQPLMLAPLPWRPSCLLPAAFPVCPHPAPGLALRPQQSTQGVLPELPPSSQHLPPSRGLCSGAQPPWSWPGESGRGGQGGGTPR